MQSTSILLNHKQPAVAAGDPHRSGGLGVVVREFALTDLAQVTRLENASFPVDAFPEWEFRRLHAAHPRGFLVAEVSGHIVGYVVGSIAGDRGEVESLAVDESARGQGIGTLLIRRLLDRFREMGLRTCRLETRTANAVAIDLYERLGFRVVGKRRGYYANGGDAFVMEHALAGRS